MRVAQRHRQSGGVALLKDEAYILEVLGEPRLRREVPGEHAFALAVHDPGVSRTALHDGESLAGVEAQSLG